MSWRKPDAVRAALARPESKPASRQEERKKEDETGVGIPVSTQTGAVGVDTKDFIVQASSAEEVIPPGATPYEAVELLATTKAQAVAKDYPDCVVIGADTVVALDGQIMGKPKDRADCVRMLSALSGREHEVYTGVALVVNGQTESFYERTAVRFLPLTEEEINWYADLDEPYDKAGAYGIRATAVCWWRASAGTTSM